MQIFATIFQAVFRLSFPLTGPIERYLIACMNTPFVPPDLDAIHVLFVLQRTSQNAEAWKRFEDHAYEGVGTCPQPKLPKHSLQNEMLAENVWLLPLKDDLHVLMLLAAAADKAGIPIRIFLARDPSSAAATVSETA